MRDPAVLAVTKPHVDLFTDGACKKTGEGGWAFVLRATSGKELESSGGATGTTSQRMELQAALSGLERLQCPCSVRLVSDSQYLVKGLSEWPFQPPSQPPSAPMPFTLARRRSTASPRF